MSAVATHNVSLRPLLRDVRHMEARAASDLADWLVFLDLEGKASRTIYTYHRETARLLRAYPDHEISDFTHRDISALLQQISPRSRHITRSIYSQFFEWAMLEERIGVTPMLRVPKIKQPRRTMRDIFSIAEVAQLEALPSPDGELFAILFGTGLRKAEARRLQRQHVDLDRRRLIVHRGKGGKSRVVAMTPSALKAVADLDLDENLQPDQHLWYCRPGGGTMVSRQWAIGDTTFSRWYADCIAKAAVTYLSPHTTRHTYHELMRLHGLSLEERKELMGHESIRTTVDQYGHVDFDVVADKLSSFDLATLGNV